MKKLVLVILTFSFLLSSLPKGYATYDPMVNSIHDATENTVVFEAESFKFDKGFKVVEDESASGGKMLQATDEDEIAVLDINIPAPAQKMVMYVEHKASDKKSNLSYLFFENFDGQSIYAENFGTIEQKRIFYGDAFGNYKLYIKSGRKGHQIDRIILKYNNVPVQIDEKTEYKSGKAELETADIAVSEEVTAGSFFIEAENGTFGHKSSKIGFDESASGGAYWYADNGTLTEPKSTPDIGTRVKFRVSEKNNYRVWVRYRTVKENRKSTWIGIDDDGYYRLDDGNIGDWKWVSAGVKPLDTGWHTLDIKYRQAQQRIDCVIITSQSWFTPSGIGAAPGMPMNPDEAGIAGYNTALGKSKIWINGIRGRADTELIVYDDDVLAPASNLVTVLGLEIEKTEDYYLLKRDRKYAKIYRNMNSAVVNGQQLKMKHMVEFAENGEMMIPITAMSRAFNLDWDYQKEWNALYIFDFYEDIGRDAKEGEIIALDGFIEDVNLKIPYDNPDAEIRVWVRCMENDNNGIQKQNFDNMNVLANGVYTYKFVSQWYGFNWSREGWVECPKPYWKDGAFYTRRGGLYNNGVYDVKVSITDNNYEDIFIAKGFTKVPSAIYPQTTEEYKLNTGGELLLESTFHNISYYIDYSLKDVPCSCEVTYRKAGESQWNKAFLPFNDDKTGQFRGSIVKLDENTEYEVRARIFGEDGRLINDKTATVKTWSEEVPVAKTIKLSDIYDGEGQLALLDIWGTEDGWIKIDGEGKTINGDKKMLEALYISNCRYLIFENAVITGGKEHCVNISNGSQNVRIINCDISGWGPGDGIFDNEMGMYYINGYFPNYVSGINIKGTQNIVVERCYIHDADARTNPWTSPLGTSVHPCGSNAIRVMGDCGTVIRYNDLVGSDKHRFNDAIEGYNNGALRWGSVGRNSDIYGNMMIYTQDDILEIDGGQMNVRVYENRIEQSLCGFSTAPSSMGPSYIFRNLGYNIGTELNEEWGQSLKMGGLGPDGYNGIIYLFNNTFDAKSHILKNANYGGSSEYHSVTRNNIAVSRTDGYYALRHYFANERDNNDYDLFYGVVDLKANTGKDELNAVYGLPTYENMENGDYRLAENSLGVDSGQYVDNFSDAYVKDGKADIGAFERGGDLKFLPYRPMDIWADLYYLSLNEKEEKTVTFHIGDIGEGHTYTIDKNKDYTWLNILSETEGTAKPNSTVEIKVSADLTGYEYEDGNGMIMLRLDNGMSVPVTVYAMRNNEK